MARYSELGVKFTGDARSLSQAFRVVNADLAKTAAQATRQTVGFKQLGDSMSALGSSLTVGVTAPLSLFAGAALKSAGAMEQTEVAFTTMLRSTTQAKAKLEDLKAFAASTPFQFPELADATRKMLALGFSSKETLPLLRTIGDAASGLGIGAEGINRITLALGQMRAKGTAQAEEMRQLAEAGIPAWEALAKTLGVSVAEAMKMVESRSVSAQTAIDAVTQAMTERFGGGMEAQAKTLVGMWSNVKDSIGFALADIGKALAPAAKALLADFIQPAIDGAKGLAHAFAQLPTPVQSAAIGMAAFAAAAGPAVWMMGQLTTSLISIRTAFVLLGPAMKLASEALAAMAPELGVIGAIVAVAYTGKKAWDEFAGSLIKVKQNAFGGQAAQGLAEMGAVSETAAQSAAKLASAFDGLGIKSTAKLADELKRAKENLVIIQQAYEKGAASAEDLAAAKDRVKQVNEQLHPSLKKTVDVLDQMSGAMQGPATLMDELSARMADLARSDANKGMQAAAQSIYDVERVSSDASAAVSKYAERLYAAGLSADAIADKMTAVRDAIVGGVVDTVPTDFSKLTLQNPWSKEDQELLNNLERSIKTIGAESQKEEWKGLFKPVTQQNKMLREVSTVLTDMSRGIASAIVHWKGLGDVGKQVAQDIAQAMIRNLIQGAFVSLGKSITGCFGQLQGLGSALSSIFGGGSGGGLLSGAAGLSGIFRSSGGSNPLAGMGGVFSGVNWGQFGGAPAGGATSAAGGLMGAGVSGAVGMVTGAISAVTGIIGGFQMMGMNKSLDILVRHTLQITLQLEAFMKLLDTRMIALHDRLMEFRTIGIGVWPQEGYSWAGPGGGGGGGVTIQVYNPNWIGFRDMGAFWDEAARALKARGIK